MTVLDSTDTEPTDDDASIGVHAVEQGERGDCARGGASPWPARRANGRGFIVGNGDVIATGTIFVAEDRLTAVGHSGSVELPKGAAGWTSRDGRSCPPSSTPTST